MNFDNKINGKCLNLGMHYCFFFTCGFAMFALLVDRSNITFTVMDYITYLVCAPPLKDFDFFSTVNKYVLIIVMTKIEPGIKLLFKTAY